MLTSGRPDASIYLIFTSSFTDMHICLFHAVCTCGTVREKDTIPPPKCVLHERPPQVLVDGVLRGCAVVDVVKREAKRPERAAAADQPHLGAARVHLGAHRSAPATLLRVERPQPHGNGR